MACDRARGRAARGTAATYKAGELARQAKTAGRHRHELLHGVRCGDGLKKVLTDGPTCQRKKEGERERRSAAGPTGPGRAAGPGNAKEEGNEPCEEQEKQAFGPKGRREGFFLLFQILFYFLFQNQFQLGIKSSSNIISNILFNSKKNVKFW